MQVLERGTIKPDRPNVYDLFFFNDTANTEIYTLSLHDALPISIAGLGHGPEDHHGSFRGQQRPNVVPISPGESLGPFVRCGRAVPPQKVRERADEDVRVQLPGGREPHADGPL